MALSARPRVGSDARPRSSRKARDDAGRTARGLVRHNRKARTCRGSGCKCHRRSACSTSSIWAGVVRRLVQSLYPGDEAGLCCRRWASCPGPSSAAIQELIFAAGSETTGRSSVVRPSMTSKVAQSSGDAPHRVPTTETQFASFCRKASTSPAGTSVRVPTFKTRMRPSADLLEERCSANAESAKQRIVDAQKAALGGPSVCICVLLHRKRNQR